MKLTLPLGPTDNRRHIIAWRQHRMIDSPEYRAWKEECQWKLKGQIPKGFKMYDPSFEDQLTYYVQIFLANKRSDAANYTKGIQDVLTNAGVWSDDKWCLPRFENVDIDKANPRIEIEIY